MDLKKIGKIISDARKRKGFTQRELAVKLHISDKAISKWERGIGSPDISFLIPLSQILDISLYELLSGEKEEIEETIKNTIQYSNNELKRKKKEHKKKVTIITILIIIMSFFIGFKLFNLYFYNIKNVISTDYSDFIKGYQVKDVEEIKSVKLEDNMYIEHYGVLIKNIFSEYEYSENDGFIKYYNKDEMKYFSLGITDRFIDYIGKDYSVFGMNDLVFDSIDKSNLLKDIKTDLDLFQYLYERRNDNINIFTSIKKIKQNYYEKALAFTVLPLCQYVTELKGDLNGYILNLDTDKNGKEISINYNNKRLTMVIIGFENGEILEILNTLVIN